MSGEAELTPLRSFNAEVPAELDDYVMYMMAAHPSNRPQNIDEVQRTLHGLAHPAKVAPAPATREAPVLSVQGNANGNGGGNGQMVRPTPATAAPAPRAVPLQASVPLRASAVPLKASVVPQQVPRVVRVRPPAQAEADLARPLPSSYAAAPAAAVYVPPSPVGMNVPEVAHETRWTSALKEVDLTPPPPKPIEFAKAPILMWQITITIVLGAITLPIYLSDVHVSPLCLLMLPALLVGKGLSLAVGHTAAVCALVIVCHLALPGAIFFHYYLRVRVFPAMMCLIWLSASIMELASCLRYSNAMFLPFTQDLAQCWQALQKSIGASVDVSNLLYIVHCAGLVGLVIALTTMVGFLFIAKQPSTLAQ